MSRPISLKRWLLLASAGAAILACAFYCDAAVQAWMAEHQATGWRTFMQRVSAWGDWPTHVLLAAFGALVAHCTRNRRWLRICLAMIVACAIAGAATRVVKIAAGRSRPSVELDAGFNAFRFNSKYHAFPSGHTASTAAFFGVLGIASLPTGLALLPIPSLIAFSRLYLGAHYFSDVIAGAILGVAIAVATSRWRFFEIEDRKSKVEH